VFTLTFVRRAGELSCSVDSFQPGDLLQFNPVGSEFRLAPSATAIYNCGPHVTPTRTIGWLNESEFCIYLDQTKFNGYAKDQVWLNVHTPSGPGWVTADWFELTIPCQKRQ
jgi:hypothetical protein